MSGNWMKGDGGSQRNTGCKQRLIIRGERLRAPLNAGLRLPARLLDYPELPLVADIFDDVAIRVEGNASQGSIACIGLRDLTPHFARRRVNEAKLLVSRDEIALRGHSGARSSQT